MRGDYLCLVVTSVSVRVGSTELHPKFRIHWNFQVEQSKEEVLTVEACS